MPRSAITTLSASMNRASSPPDATFMSGPGWVPGLVRTQNSNRSIPCDPGLSGVDEMAVENRALVKPQRLEFRVYRLVEPLGDLMAGVFR